MNYYAAKELGIAYPYGADTVAVGATLSPEQKKWTEEHEKREVAYMKQGINYREAHAQVLLDMKDAANRKEAFQDADKMKKNAEEAGKQKSKSSL